MPSIAASSSSLPLGPISHGVSSLAARLTAGSAKAPIHNGGPPAWAGRSASEAPGTSPQVPLRSRVSPDHRARMIGTYSRNLASRSPQATPNAAVSRRR